MNKKLLAVLAVGALALTGCVEGATENDMGGPTYSTKEVVHTLEDGRKMDCLIYSPNSYRGGITCDWGNAK